MRALATSGRPNRWHGLAAAVAVVAIALLALGDALQVASTAEQASSPSPQASTSPTPGQTTAPSWAPIEVPPLEPVATLEPSEADDAGIARDATFALASLAGEPAQRLAERLEITPTAPYAVVPGTTPDTVTIRPEAALTAGTTYRFVLRGAEGATAASWAYRVRGPVRVLSTLPADATVGVPVRTGVEVTFDQDGVAGMSANFSIEPVVNGTFERHGRTQVFVPSSLAPATLYTVTIHKGLARMGTDLALGEDVVFRFETEGPETDEARLVFGREALEVAPGDPPMIAVRAIRPWVGDDRVPAPTSARLRVYRFDSIDAASRALSQFLEAPRWTAFSEPRIPTDGLHVVASFTAPLESFRDDTLLLRYPETLSEGIYVLELEGSRPAQAVLQVTSVSAWVSVMTDRTVAWVNDVVLQRPIEGARVALEGGGRIATSNGDGLAIGATPDGLGSPLDAAATGYPILRVTAPNGDTTLVPFNVAGDLSYRGEWWEMNGSADERYWSMLSTDRGLYRRVDRIQAWGFLRGRDDGQVPSSVTLRLVLGNADADPDIASVAETQVHPGPEGSFSASLPIDGLPINGYVLQAVVDGHVVVSRWLDVTVIRKPAYQLELVPDRRAAITGDRVTWTVTATFFDGTPVPGLELALTDNQGGGEHRVTTDAEGRATEARAAPREADGPWSSWWMEVRPTGPESGEIYASGTVVVFPTADLLTPKAVLGDGRLRVTGSLLAIDFANLERQLGANLWEWEATGRPVAGVTIDMAVTELVPVRRQVGSAYDFVEKVVRPVYEHDTQRRALPGSSVETAADGTFAISTTVPDDEAQYELIFSASDQAGRTQQRTIWVRPDGFEVDGAGVTFVNTDGRLAGGVRYRIGATVDWRMVDDGRALPSGGPDRYLYLVAQRGLRSAVVTRTPGFRRTFGAADAPGVFVIGVRFTGTTYAPKAAAWANFDQTQREIKVAVSADRPAYRPGETATLSVRTTDPAGRPVPATVLLQAVDEKLYAMGGAEVPQPLDDLYRRVDSGILRLTATHQVPSMAGPEGEGGDTTGGGARSDFRDTLLFRMLRTDASGRASATVRLSDDLTSWHVSAGALTAELEGGVGELLVPVRLPFFVELTIADAYQVADRPVVLARAFGSELRAGDDVEFIASSTSLGMPETTVRGTAFDTVRVELPALRAGPQTITLRARTVDRTDDAGRPYADGLTRSFEVVGSRLTATATAFGVLEPGGEGELPVLPAGAESTVWTFTDAGRGRLLPTLAALTDTGSLRIDAGIARQAATEMLVSAFGRDPAEQPPGDFDPGIYAFGRYDDAADGAPRAGVALLPYADLDPWLAARIAILAPSALRPDIMDEVLNSIRDEPSTRRDLWIAATAGLAALGDPVLEDLDAAAREGDLSQGERLYLALGFEAAGDDASARRIEQELLAGDGETLGSWVRLRSTRTADGSDATALLAVVAAGLGDPLAASLADYAAANPAPDAFDALELVAYARRTLDRTPATTASFAYTVEGRRRVVELEAGGAFWLPLTANQAGGLAVESLSGRVGIAVEGRVPVAASSLVTHRDLSLTRELPSRPIPADGLVEVNLAVEFEAGAPDGCYDVREVVPSGLAPLTMGWGQTDEEGITWPWSVVGQEVRFCASNDAESGRTARLRYVARVVNEGTFAWEPAVMQFANAAELMAVAPAATVTIGAP
jgi:hypothetical protein